MLVVTIKHESNLALSSGEQLMFPPLHPAQGKTNLKADLDGQNRIHSSQYAHGN